ncbi:MAG: prolyl oligopeptidase family serine peptidase, partial [Bacteroidia bacterium]
ELLSQDSYSYPPARRMNQLDTIFGTLVSDPYRWMEKIDDPEVLQWLEAEKKLSEKYKIGLYSIFEEYLNQNSKIYYKPVLKKGCYYFTYLIEREDRTPSLFYQKKTEDVPDLLFNPNKIDRSAMIKIDGIEISSDNKTLALSLGRNGSDWRFIRFLDMSTKKLINDSIDFVKYGRMYWYKNGLFYTRYDVKSTQESFTGIIKGRSVYYHKLGTSQENDILVYKPQDGFKSFSYEVTPDEKHMVLYVDSAKQGEYFRTVLLAKLNDDLNVQFKLCISSKKKDVYFNVLGELNGKLLIQSNYSSPNGAVFSYDYGAVNHLSVFIKQYKDQLESSYVIGKSIINAYSNDSLSFVVVFDSTGKITKTMSIPPGYKFSYFSVSPNDDTFVYGFHSFFSPSSVYKMNISTNENEPVGKTYVHFSNEGIVTKKVYYLSKDSTSVPMYLTYRKGIKLNGKNPVLLYGYGGFGIKTEPFFDVGNLVFINSGGILAAPCIRGGGDFPGWHEKGKLLNKQNSFDDFISAAEFLISSNYTNSDKLVAIGGSNGGLLVSAVMLQRPELFKAIVSTAGVLDMMRFHLYNIGYDWKYEYGNVAREEEFKNLLNYSPVHNVKSNVTYPSVLLVAGSNDDRVSPFHSFKFLAELQARSNGKNPYLLYYKKDAGHYGGSTMEQKIETKTFIYSFIFRSLGMERKIDLRMD